MATVHFFKMLIMNMMLYIFIRLVNNGLLIINIFKILFWERGREGGVTKKSRPTLCTLLIMLTIMDDPLYRAT